MQRPMARGRKSASLIKTLLMAGVAALCASPIAGSVSVEFEYESQLSNSFFEMIEGEETEDGGCAWEIPELTLEDDEDAIEARQVEADYEECTSIIEIGTPTETDENDPDGDEDEGESDDPQPPPPFELPPELDLPTNESVIDSNETFRFHFADEGSLQVQYATNSQFWPGSIVCDSGWYDSGFYTDSWWDLGDEIGFSSVECSLPAGTYYWRARWGGYHFDPPDQDAMWSEPWSFTIEDSFASLSMRLTKSVDSSGEEGFSELVDGPRVRQFTVWWEEPANWDVSRVRSFISWNWNGSCVTSSTGWHTTWWKSTLGWVKSYSNSARTTGCASHFNNANAKMHVYSSLFCPWFDVHTTYQNVRVRGGYQGGMGSYLGRTWTTNSHGLCPSLHWRARLLKVSG